MLLMAQAQIRNAGVSNKNHPSKCGKKNHSSEILHTGEHLRDGFTHILQRPLKWKWTERPLVTEPLALLQKGADCIQTWKPMKYSFSHKEHFLGHEDMLVSHAVNTSLCSLDTACWNPPSQFKISNSKTLHLSFHCAQSQNNSFYFAKCCCAITLYPLPSACYGLLRLLSIETLLAANRMDFCLDDCWTRMQKCWVLKQPLSRWGLTPVTDWQSPIMICSSNVVYTGLSLEISQHADILYKLHNISQEM